MKLKTLFAACVLAVSILAIGVGNSFAINQSIDLSSGFASFIGQGPLLDGGDDILTFTNLPVGNYNFDFSMSSQYADITNVFVNAQAATQISSGVFRFFGLTSVDTSPFVISILGTAASNARYSGELQVTAVPESATVFLIFAGLAMVGLAAHQRKIA